MQSTTVDARMDPSLWQRPEPLYPLLARAVGLLLRLVYRVRVGGGDIPRSGPVLLAANHIAHLDPVVLAVTLHKRGRKTRFLAVSGLWSVPVVGWLLRVGRMVPVYRGGGVDRMTEDACVALDAGEAVLVYPEGTIADPTERVPARPGAGHLALHSAGPVVPVTVWGLGPDPVVRRPLRRRVGVVIGAPVDLPEHRGDGLELTDVAQHILDAVRALRPEAERLARSG